LELYLSTTHYVMIAITVPCEILQYSSKVFIPNLRGISSKYTYANTQKLGFARSKAEKGKEKESNQVGELPPMIVPGHAWHEE
jgi:hypothetical protein